MSDNKNNDTQGELGELCRSHTEGKEFCGNGVALKKWIDLLGEGK